MGFNLKRAATAVATGGNSEWGANGNLWGGGGSTTQDQVPLQTPEQLAARQLLLNYSQTGKIGDNYTAGQNIGIQPGDYAMTGLEQQGQSAIQSLLNAGTPQGFLASDKATADLMNTTPEGLDAMFRPYEAINQRLQTNAENSAKRSAAFGGNLYSSDTIRNLGDVAAKTAETNQATLAGLQNDALNRKLQAAGLAQNSATGQQNILQQRIADAMQYGALQRNLNNAQVTDANNEKLRQRNEILNQLTGATAVSGAPVQFGVPSVTVQNPNPYMDFLKVAAQFGGSGAMTNFFGSGSSSPTPSLPQGYSPYPTSGNPLSFY